MATAPATVTDVAMKAGVSRSSAYQILAAPDHPSYSPATRRRVLQASKELCYVPHAAARALRTRQTNTICMFAGEKQFSQGQTGGFAADLLPGLYTAASRLGYHVLIELECPAEPERNLNLYRELINSGRIDGLIITGPQKDDPRLEIVGSSRIPFVAIGRPDPNNQCDSVGSDSISAARLAAQHLLDLGHRRIAHLTGPASRHVFEDRRRGYHEAMAAARAKPTDLVGYDEGFIPKRPAEELVEELWSSPQPPTAVMADDDVLAAGVMHALQKRGLAVPGDVSVVGMNDNMICQRTRPELTTVRLNVRRLGEEAARLLISRIKNPAQPVRPRVVVPGELVVRESSRRL
ncbi:MAG: LacI family DNA-binding transcriptional regulator [Planctomycetota bacterium]|nr:LacI family DNA-binding transcriptional regulator [Planctomycetota bacterium]